MVNFNDKIFTKVIKYFEFNYLWRLIGIIYMAGNDNQIMRRRLANAYLSSVISISLVLLLVGVASLLLVNARGVSDYFKENMQVSVLMKQSVSDEDALEYRADLEKYRFIKSTVFISREQGQRELADQLGDDFLDIFETSPIPVSIDITLNADYVSADSLEVVKSEIAASPLVDEVVYQKTLVDALNANLNKISMVIGVFVALMLFISYVLINNTVRLNVFSRRFTIHTMKLVGATRSFIRAPFLLQSAFQGLFSAFIAIMALVAMLYFMRNEFEQLFEIFRLDLLLTVMAIVVVSGLVICLASTWFVVNKLVSLTKDELYY
jgi:cell division transport system permease protein